MRGIMSTAVLEIPKDLQQLAAKLGANVGPNVKFDAEKSLRNLHALYTGASVGADFGCDMTIGSDGEIGCCFGVEDSQFGFSFKKFLRKVTHTIGDVGKIVGKVASVGVFAIPGIGPIAGGALAAADKLLGSKKGAQVNAAIISNTKALAALGDPAAIRGAQALATVSQIRKQTNTPAGKSVIPGASRATPVAPYIAQVSRFQANARAQTQINRSGKVGTPVISPIIMQKPGFWTHFKAWWKGDAKPAPLVTVTTKKTA